MKIESKQDVLKLERGLREIKIQKERFIIATVSDLIKSIIIDEIQNEMRRENYDEKIIDAVLLANVRLSGKNKVKFTILNHYVTDTGFDVALALERTGTTDHLVEADEERQTESGRPPALKIQMGTGAPLFRRSAFVSGIEAKHIIENAINDLSPEVQREYKKREATWIRSHLNS